MTKSGYQQILADIEEPLAIQFRQEIIRKYGGKKGDLARALRQAIKYFLVLSPVKMKMTKAEAKEIKQVLLGEFFVRDVDMATKTDMKMKPALEKAINTIMGALKLMKDLGVLHVEE